ncbi:MAG: hypothetical protein JO044_01665 [Mycobacteriaceae bacterium]|nr:hypothetical protein [Mycobacteriaceae bacterium]MBV9640725.1 hypothetical protein [Mycobacteriaceae bacterium]
MARFARHAGRLIWAAGPVIVIAAVCVVGPLPGRSSVIAGCPPNEFPNPRGYGCVPALARGGAIVGAPTQQELSACHGGSLYFCIDPYGRR